jgi:hypothetical protein
MSVPFATTDPRIAGRTDAVGASVIYVTGGAGVLLFKYGTSNTAWCTVPVEGASEPVTADPRTGAGLARHVGARVMYVTGKTGATLLKYGTGDTDWCTYSSPPSAVTTTLVAARAAASTAINTTAPLTGGGDLTASRTLAVNTFGAAQAGVVPASGGSPSNFLRADGVWSTPASVPGDLSTVVSADSTINAAATRVVHGLYEIGDGFTLEIGDGAYLEIT